MQIQDILPEELIECDTVIVRYRRAIEGCGLTDGCPSIVQVVISLQIMNYFSFIFFRKETSSFNAKYFNYDFFKSFKNCTLYLIAINCT